MLSDLERFIIIVEKSSFTQASKKLFITQPALTISIKRLEEELRVKLFNRNGKRLALTREGENVYQIALRIQKLWERAKIQGKKDGEHDSHVYIGLFDNAALKLSKYFQKNLGKQHFEISIDRSMTLLRSLSNGILDICVCVIPHDLSHLPNITLIKTFSETLVPVSGKIWLHKVSEIPFILYNKDSQTQHYVNAVFFKRGIRPNVIVESTNPAFMRQLALGNGGVALLPKDFVEHDIEQKRLFVQQFPFTFKRKIGLFLRKDGNIRDSDEIVTELVKNLQ